MSAERQRRRLNGARNRRARRNSTGKVHVILLKEDRTGKGAPVPIETTGGLPGEIADGVDYRDRVDRDTGEVTGIEVVAQGSAAAPRTELEAARYFALVREGETSGPYYAMSPAGRPEDLIGERVWRWESTGRLDGTHQVLYFGITDAWSDFVAA